MISSEQEKAIGRVLQAIEAIRSKGMVIMVDDEDRENEGDLVFAAEHVNDAMVNFMCKEARGLICLTLAPEIVDKLQLPLMNAPLHKSESRSTAFTVSIEARQGVTTGISAKDRAQTIRVAIDDKTTAQDLVVPGHIFPLKAKSGGVLERAGHTEGSVDLARLAGLKPAGVICEIMNDDGTMARFSDLEKFSAKHNIPIVAIADIITFLLLKESLIELIEERPVATSHGTFKGYLFRSVIDQGFHLAVVKGDQFEDQVVDVRVHRQRPFLDIFKNTSTQGGQRLDYGLNILAQKENSVLLYMSQKHEPESWLADFRQLDPSFDKNTSDPKAGQLPHSSNSPMDPRLYGIGAQILRHLGVKRMNIHVSSPIALKGLGGFGLEIMDTIIIDQNPM